MLSVKRKYSKLDPEYYDYRFFLLYSFSVLVGRVVFGTAISFTIKNLHQYNLQVYFLCGTHLFHVICFTTVSEFKDVERFGTNHTYNKSEFGSIE